MRNKKKKKLELRLVKVETKKAKKTKNHPDGPYVTTVEHHAHDGKVGFEEVIRSKTPGITMDQLQDAYKKALLGIGNVEGSLKTGGHL